MTCCERLRERLPGGWKQPASSVRRNVVGGVNRKVWLLRTKLYVANRARGYIGNLAKNTVAVLLGELRLKRD